MRIICSCTRQTAPYSSLDGDSSLGDGLGGLGGLGGLCKCTPGAGLLGGGGGWVP